MSIFDDFKNSPLNPVDIWRREDAEGNANRYLDQIPGIGKKYYNPYIGQGQKAGALLGHEYDKLMNPTSFIDELMKNYSQSEGSKYAQDRLGKDIGATAAAGGFAGTPEHQQEYGDMAHKLLSGDMQQYLQNALGVYGTGLSGRQDVYNKGFEASGSLADMIAGTRASQGGLAYQSATQRNTDRQALLNALVKALSQGAGAGG